ncbi:MAG: hypothetical protein SOX13_06970 [Sodaliphilus sp.]|nr:hypothetical protein [Sodaliphilus sp.]
MLPNREWNQKQKHKKQSWSNVECFTFGGATVRFASLETSFHAANHTIPPPPSYEGYPLIIMGGREVSRPYRNWFFAEGERFLSF